MLFLFYNFALMFYINVFLYILFCFVLLLSGHSIDALHEICRHVTTFVFMKTESKACQDDETLSHDYS